MKKLIVFTTVVMAVTSLLAQDKYYSNNKKAISQFEKAMNVLYSGKFNQGILELENVLKRNYESEKEEIRPQRHSEKRQNAIDSRLL